MANKKEITPNSHAKELRKMKLKLSMSELFDLSGIPVRTIEDYESGRRKTPQKYYDKLEALYVKDRAMMEKLKAEIDSTIEAMYPNGILSR